jgi:type I restriction enzyme S subunit
MTELPKGWIYESIASIVKGGMIADGDWVESKDQDPDGEVRLTQLADVGDGDFRNRSDRWMNNEQASRLNVNYLQPGDLLMARMPDPLGRTCIVPNNIGRAVTVVDVAIIRIVRQDINPKFIMWLLNSPGIRQQIEMLSSGTTRRRITRKNLGTIDLPLPPIDEQNKIVELIEDQLSRLDAALADVKQARIKSAQFRQSLLNSVFYGHKFESVDLGTCIDLIMGQAPPGVTCNKNGDGTPFVKVGEFAKLYPTIEEWTLKPLRLAKKGDVLICVVGATVGKINLGIDCAIGRSVAAIRPKNTLLQKYLYYFLELKMLEIRGQSKGSAQGVITKDYINSIQIPLPELKAQQDVLDLLESNFSQLEKSIEVSNIIERESVSLRRSLLQAAFTGQLAKEVVSV